MYLKTEDDTSSDRGGLIKCNGLEVMEPSCWTAEVIFGKKVCSGSIGTSIKAGPGDFSSEINSALKGRFESTSKYGISKADANSFHFGSPKPVDESQPTHAPLK